MDSKHREALIRDILAAQHDLVGLGSAHQLSPDELAEWIGDAANHHVLSGLCRLADLQTQLLLSRYRMLAATRLIKLATDEQQVQDKPDVTRRACVDLLRLDLKRADPDAGAAGAGDSDLQQANQQIHDEFERISARLMHYETEQSDGDAPCTDEAT